LNFIQRSIEKLWAWFFYFYFGLNSAFGFDVSGVLWMIMYQLWRKWHVRFLKWWLMV
jgi:hypothetical protein